MPNMTEVATISPSVKESAIISPNVAELLTTSSHVTEFPTISPNVKGSATTIQIKTEFKSEIKLENLEEFEAQQQAGIDFITSNNFDQFSSTTKVLQSDMVIKKEHSVGTKDFFCDLCSLQFDKDTVYN